MDVDNRSVELPEDFPQFPNRTEFIQELVEVLQSFGLSGTAGTARRSSPSTPSAALRRLEDDGRNGNLEDLLQGNPTLQRLQALTRRTGVTVALTAAAGPRTASEEEELRNAKLNVQLREVFASRFTAMFADYESFVIQSASDLQSWLTNREQMHNFDKVLKSKRTTVVL